MLFYAFAVSAFLILHLCVTVSLSFIAPQFFVLTIRAVEAISSDYHPLECMWLTLKVGPES